MMTQLCDAYTREELEGDGLTHWERDKNGSHYTDDIFKRIFLNENVIISIKI